MKLKLTEQQIKNLINRLDPPESSNLNIDTDAFAKLSPKLTDFINKFKILTSDGNQSTTENPNFVSKPVRNPVNVPVGEGPMHPLGHSGKITSGYGRRSSSVGSKNHKGIDISTPSGSPVYAPLDGEVMESRDTTPNACGGFIKLDHANIQTKFCHLKRLIVKQGQKVKKGQVIGYSGGGRNDPMRGTATGPHLHYEVLDKSGIAMNPSRIYSNLA